MEKIKIVIPSHKRADRVITTHTVEGAIICVPKSQEEEYRRYNPEVEILAHPDSIIGLSPKRQWIYDKFGDVFMIDDDIKSIDRMYISPDEKNSKVTPHDATILINHMYEICKELEIYYFGFGNAIKPVYYNDFEPISYSGYVLGGGFGILKSPKLKIQNDGVAVEDFFLACINAYYHRKAWIDNRFALKPEKTFMNVGGMSEHRTKDTEKSDTMYLKKLFGDVIKLKPARKNKRALHKYERSMQIPF